MAAPQPKRISVEIVNKYIKDIGAIYIKPNHFELAKDIAQIDKILGPKALSVDYMAYGILSALRYDYDGMKMGFNNALARDSDSLTSYNYGLSLIRFNLIDESIDNFSNAFNADPNENNKSALCNAQLVSGRYHDAKKTYFVNNIEIKNTQFFEDYFYDFDSFLVSYKPDLNLIKEMINEAIEYLRSSKIKFVWHSYIQSDGESSWVVYGASVYNIDDNDHRLVDINMSLLDLTIKYAKKGRIDPVVLVAERENADSPR